MENTVQQEVRFKKRMKRSNDYDLAIEKLLKKQKKILNAVWANERSRKSKRN